MSDNKNLKPIIFPKKICQRESPRQSVNSVKLSTVDHLNFKDLKSEQPSFKDLKSEQSSFKYFTPRQKSPRQCSPRRLTPISTLNFNPNYVKNTLKIDKNIIMEPVNDVNTNNISSGYNKITKETYDDEQIYINKTNNIDVSIEVINTNDNLVKELKQYANKINECKIFDNFTLDDLIKIKQHTYNLENKSANLKLNYESLMSFTESMDELIDYFASLDKEVSRIYNVTDEQILVNLLDVFKKIYTLINTFEKLKVNININTQINLKLSTLELNSILDSITTKITNVNKQIVKFMNGASNKNIDEILNFLDHDDCEEINYALVYSLTTLNDNLEKFNDSSRLLKNTLNQLKEKIKKA